MTGAWIAEASRLFGGPASNRRPWRGHLARESLTWLLLTVISAASLAVAIVFGRLGLGVAFALAPAAVLAICACFRLARGTDGGRFALVTTWTLLLFSTFVWRARTTAQLNSNPLDRAGMLRVALVGAAGIFALGYFSRRRILTLRIPAALRWFCAYLVVAFAAAMTSPLPLQATYRVFEFAVGLLAVIILALSIERRRRPEFLFRLTQTSMVAVLAVVWFEAMALPGKSWEPTPGIDPYTLHGYLPSYASNSVGMYGGLLAITSLPFVIRKNNARRYQFVYFALGLVTLLASQYRTGIVAFVVALPLVVTPRHRVLIAGALAAGAALLLAGGFARETASTATTAFAKGRPELVGTLDSRTTYWRAAARLVRERPELGWGLDVGSRRALASIGDESGSTIHGTWVEALLGTGLVGTVLLAASFLLAFREGWKIRTHPIGAAVAGLVLFLMIRSITGTTLELFSDVWMIFAALTLAAHELRAGRPWLLREHRETHV